MTPADVRQPVDLGGSNPPACGFESRRPHSWRARQAQYEGRRGVLLSEPDFEPEDDR